MCVYMYFKHTQYLHIQTHTGGFPITLRHRLHATIVRAGDAGTALPEQQEQQGTLPCVGRGCLGAVYGKCMYVHKE